MEFGKPSTLKRNAFLWKRGAITFLWYIASTSGSAAPADATPARTVIDLNAEWLFIEGDSAAARSVDFDESICRVVCLPHTNKRVPHTNIDASSFAFVSWYRKHFTLPAKYEGKRLKLAFEAVSKAAEVFVNGQYIGSHKGAYTPFSFDISGHLVMGADNVIAVRVDSRLRRDIPPEGINIDYMVFGGIVRDVSLSVVDPLHIHWVYAKRDTGKKSLLTVETMLVNEGNVSKRCSVTTQLLDSSGGIVAQAAGSQFIAPHARKLFTRSVGPVADPRQWHPDAPYLYTIRTVAAEGGRVADSHTVRFGIRTFAFSKTTGRFTVNGAPLKLRGLNRHETFPFIGRAAANRLQARDAEIIKHDFGCNIVRCSHYPQDPAFLDRCDEIGLLVLEEMAGWAYVARDSGWRETALINLEEMILRDRNHASLISFGVRINQSADFHDFYEKSNRLARTLDPSRPTHGTRVLGRGSQCEFMEDIWTQNFLIPDSTPPLLPWITTEIVGHQFPAHSWDKGERLLRHMLAHAAAHDSAMANPAVAGLLGWCAFDYNSTYRYAEHSICYHGVADIFRIPKPAAYFYASQCDPAIYGPMIYIFHEWEKTYSSNDVWVASNCDSVELFVNGASQGKQAPGRFGHLPHPLFIWKTIPFRAGEIRAVGFVRDSVMVTTVRKTPGAAKRLTLVPDDTLLRSGGDMTRVVVTAVDAKGRPILRANNRIEITVGGGGDFLGKSPITLENGKTAFFVKTRGVEAGTINCSVKSRGLKAAHAHIGVISKPEPGKIMDENISSAPSIHPPSRGGTGRMKRRVTP
ncbi:MAG: DUF4982 domain-containing protein [Chitinispirillaceae bacterium]|nr:DUF4982 domain-containing protein [Chitinispirillaceae bacterium]